MRGSPSKSSQRGIALFISLVILMLLTIVGVAAVQTTQLQARMARNAHDNLIAVQAAERALLEGERFLLSAPPDAARFTASGSDGLWRPARFGRSTSVAGGGCLGGEREPQPQGRVPGRCGHGTALPDRVADHPDRAGQSPLAGALHRRERPANGRVSNHRPGIRGHGAGAGATAKHFRRALAAGERPLNRSAAAWVGMALFAAGLAETGASERLAAFAFGSGASSKGGVEYRAFHDLKAGTGDLHAVRFDGEGSGVLWRAARQLERAVPDERIVLTQDRTAWTGQPFAYGRLNSDQKAVLDEAAVEWLRGEGNARRLGPIVGSEPVIVGAPQAVGRSRTPYPLGRGGAYAEFAADWARRPEVVYVSSNDGLLHAFKADNGHELFAYVPNKLIDGDQRFATQLNVRASGSTSALTLRLPAPTVEDAYVKLAPANARKGWRTLLIGGLGEAGKGYFALDVTDPEASAVSAEAAAGMVLWEFTDADDRPPIDADGQPVADLDEYGAPVKDLGYATSQARVAMSNVRDGRGGRNWVAVLGNGEGSTAGRAVLFVLFVDEGARRLGSGRLRQGAGRGRFRAGRAGLGG